MSYLVFCTFDLENADSVDYKNAYSDLSSIGLNKIQIKNSGDQAVIPTTSVMGKFKGSSAESVTDVILARVKKSFKSRNFTSEIFIVVGGDWAWNASNT